MGRGVGRDRPFRPSVASIERMPPWSRPAAPVFQPCCKSRFEVVLVWTSLRHLRILDQMFEPGSPVSAADAAPRSLLRLLTALSGDVTGVGVVPDERTYRGFIDSLGVALYTTDAEGRLTYFNEAAVALWGRRPELGELWCGSWRLFWLDGRPMAHAECPMAVALRENRAVRGATAIAERPDGSRVFFQPYPSPLRDPDGRLVGGVNVLIDVSDRQQAEKALEATTEALAVSSAARDDFLGLVSHELRTPVTTIYGNARSAARSGRSAPGCGARHGRRHRGRFGAASRDRREPPAVEPPPGRRRARSRAGTAAARRRAGGRGVHQAPSRAGRRVRRARPPRGRGSGSGLPHARGAEPALQRRQVRRQRARSRSSSTTTRSKLASRSWIAGWASMASIRRISSRRSSAPRRRRRPRAASALACRSAAGSSRRWAAGSGRGRAMAVAPNSGSRSRSAPIPRETEA